MVNWQAKGVAAKVPSTELGSWGCAEDDEKLLAQSCGERAW